MTTSITLSSLLALMASCVTACSGGNTNAIEDFNSNLIAAICDSEVACSQQPSEAVCKASYPQVTSAADATLIADVHAGVVRFDGDVFSKCLDQLTSERCEPLAALLVDEVGVCLTQVFTGTVAEGGSCFIDEECESQQCGSQAAGCDPASACCPGICTEVLAHGIGDACNGPFSCGEGEYCSLGNAGTGSCEPQHTSQGDTCDPSSSLSCADPFVCVSDAASDGHATCQALPAEGDACAVTGLACDGPDYCDPRSLTCTPLVEVGAACSDDAPCEGRATCIAGTCVAKGAIGHACVPNETDPPCLGSLACTNGVCEPQSQLAGFNCR
jgi:hypothetical protein